MFNVLILLVSVGFKTSRMMFTQKGEVCNGCEFYDRENTSTYFTVICVCNILMGNLLL